MSLRLTQTLLGSRGSTYDSRVMVYAHRRQRARYLPPKKAHKHDAVANKPVEEYGNTWDPRSGIEWYYRMRKRNHYRHWPWARWVDDPVRGHADFTNRRSFSALSGAANEGVPEWDYYSEVGQAYDTPSHFPLTFTAPFIHQYTGKVWSQTQLERDLERIQTETDLKSIADVAAHPAALWHWHTQQQQHETVPRGLLFHLELVARDIVAQNVCKANRQVQQETGVLRTREMARYFALPYLRSGPAMPVALAQPSGEYPWGKYTYIKAAVDYHPLQVPDGRFKHNMHPT